MTDSSSPKDFPPLSYRDAGVDIDAAQKLIERINPAVSETLRPEVLAGLGDFGALFELPIHRYQHPVLVSGTDGVGTKLKLAQQLNQHHGIGIDLVAMCANDILVHGAEPLFFLDYFATGKLELEVATRVIEGIADGCSQAGAALVGGETAEMPGIYAAGEYDLAGFCVGIVEKDKLLDGNDIKPGDLLMGLASSGLHSNGYSLVRRIVEREALDLAQPFANSTFGEILLTPTRIYVRTLLPLIRQTAVKALAHITGGGITENLPRVLPQDFDAHIQLNRWPRPEIFGWLQRAGQIDDMEMLRTFNCGLGMIAVVAPQRVDDCIQHSEQTGTQAWVIGELALGAGKPRVVCT